MRNSYRAYHPRGELVEGYQSRKHPLYRTHSAMLDRCLNQNCNAYHNYGGRGIKIDSRWMSFVNFVADMGAKPTPAHTLERKDNNGEYSPSNCVWATRTTQCVNRRVFESSATGHAGVKPVGGGFMAAFDFEGKRYAIGRYTHLDDAVLARSAYVEGFLAARGGLHG